MNFQQLTINITADRTTRRKVVCSSEQADVIGGKSLYLILRIFDSWRQNVI
ncbi:hypothetical protein QUA44_23770 [Microcoleus sp. N9_A2]|uniref:hypothetical protein n=1 Tax=unclassified Microcoleus TaxID=2642155 RepID=UPI002FD274AA